MRKAPSLSGGRSATGSVIKRTGVAGIVLGVMALFACEVPIILAFVGIGGLGAGTAAFAPTSLLEIGGMVLAVLGGTLLMVFKLRRMRSRRRESQV